MEFLSKSLSCRILLGIIINKEIIVKLEKCCAYCSHSKSVGPGVFAPRFASIMCLRGFVFHEINCSSDFLFWKIFLLDLMWVQFVLHKSKLFPLESYVGLISLHASEGFPSRQIISGLTIMREFIKPKFYVDIKLSWLHMFLFLQLFKTIGVVYARAFSFLDLVQIGCFYRVSLLETDFSILSYNGLSKIFWVCQKSCFERCIGFGQKIFLFSLP